MGKRQSRALFEQLYEESSHGNNTPRYVTFPGETGPVYPHSSYILHTHTHTHAPVHLSPVQLENFLLANQEDYFEYSSRNYTAEQRNYNNTLTRGLLDLASTEGYTFEEFTFSQVRDRIRCYFKSYSQSAKKKRKGI